MKYVMLILCLFYFSNSFASVRDTIPEPPKLKSSDTAAIKQTPDSEYIYFDTLTIRIPARDLARWRATIKMDKDKITVLAWELTNIEFEEQTKKQTVKKPVKK